MNSLTLTLTLITLSGGKMASEDIKQKIEEANGEAAKRLNAADPVLVDIAPAGEVIPGLGDKMILHSGPPVDWARMCGAQRGAMIGVVLYEGWAKSPEEAVRLLEGGDDQIRAQSPSPGGGSHGRHDLRLHAGLGRGEPGLRQPGVLPAGRRPAAVRGIQRRGAGRPPPLAGCLGAGPAERAAPARRPGAEAHHRQGLADGG